MEEKLKKAGISISVDDILNVKPKGALKENEEVSQSISLPSTTRLTDASDKFDAKMDELGKRLDGS